jgi:DNA-binding IscR family transcriptional regulator
MALTSYSEYGRRARIHLAYIRICDPPGVAQMRELPARDHTFARFLEQNLLSLRNTALLHNRLRIGGGYHLSHLAKCVSHLAYEPCGCPDKNTCGPRMVMGDVRNPTSKVLSNTTLDAVIHEAKPARPY